MAKTIARETADKIVREWVATMDECVMRPSGRLTAIKAQIESALLTVAREAAETRPQGWEWYHEHDAALIRRDGMMCEQHPGTEFPHDDCAGPGMAWGVEGRDAIQAFASSVAREQRERAFDEAIAVVKPWTDAYKSCHEHFDDPCCHVRLGVTITTALEQIRTQETSKVGE